LGVSVGDLFVGAFVPGLMLAGLLALYVAGVALFRPTAAPALPASERSEAGPRLIRRVLIVLLPPLTLILLVLGSIFFGIATPTEAGAMGGLGAILLALVHRRLTRTSLWEASVETTSLTAMVIWLLIGATMFTLVFRGLGGDLWVADALSSLPGGKIGFLIIANIAIFLLGFFLDFFEIAFILVPLLVPVAQRFGLDMVWFGVMMGMNLQTSFLTPPFGFALFYLRGVAPADVRTTQIYRGVVPFIILQLIALTLIILFPGLVSR
ncbi:MAG: TRAP transporter large permease subunit, partial [Gemmatimonadales bacterium]